MGFANSRFQGDYVNRSGDTMTGDLLFTGVRHIKSNDTLILGGDGNDALQIGNVLAGHSFLVGINANTWVFFLVQKATGSAPSYVKGGQYFDSTLNSVMIGGASAWVAAATLAAARDAPHIINKVASANVRNSHDAAITGIVGDGATYVKKKTITLDNGLVGQQRFLFDLQSDDGASTVKGRIYRNGVALGSEQTTTNAAYVTKSEDITQTWNPGDTCELWVVGGAAAATASIRNFRIAYDDSANVAVASTNT